MSSPARQLANAANAQLSTGPRTDEGKACSSQNARTHGLTSQHPVIAGDQRHHFEERRAQLHAETRPEGALQEVIFEELLASAWNLRRIRIMEAELTAAAPSDFLANDEFAAKFDRLARYHTRFERSFYRALRELKALHTDAALTRTLPAYFMQTSPPLASRAHIAKRTQILALNDRIFGADEYFTGAEAEAAALFRVLKDHQQLSQSAAN